MTPRTSVLVLGDARNNYHSAEAWVQGELRARARHLYWLNRSRAPTGTPATRSSPPTGPHCDGVFVFECRNLRQLERFVEQIG